MTLISIVRGHAVPCESGRVDQRTDGGVCVAMQNLDQVAIVVGLDGLQRYAEFDDLDRYRLLDDRLKATQDFSPLESSSANSTQS